MSLFYHDQTIISLENEHKYNQIIEYLEKQKQTTKIKATLIAYSWFFATDNEQIEYNDYFLEKWRDLYLEYLQSNIKDCHIDLILGYTLDISWMYLFDSDKETLGKTLIKQASLTTSDRFIRDFAKYCLSNNFKKSLDITIAEVLFPSESIIDKYFKSVISFQ